MTKEEIKDYIESFVWFEYIEFGIPREAAVSLLYEEAIEFFENDTLSEEDMISFIEYIIGHSISEEELAKIRANKEKKRLEREQKKLEKKVNK